MMSAQLSNAPSRAIADAVAATLGDLGRHSATAFSALSAWPARARMRRELGRLAATDHRLLADAGFDPVWAAAEMEKPFWQA